MKQCPNCKTQYTDDTLQFCLQDGTPLVTVPAGGHADETETVISNRTRGQQAEPTIVSGRMPYEAPPPRRRNGTFAIVAVTALVTFLIVGLAAAGFFIYQRQRQRENARFTPDKPAESTPTPTPKPTQTPTPSPSPSPTPSQTPVDRAEIADEVADSVSAWAEDTSSGDIDRLMRDYAPVVDYYRAGNIGRDAVRKDKSRAVENYDSIEVDVSNIKVTVDDSGDTATAQFDKSWLFSGDRPYEGAVRSQLKLKKENGRWLITSEKDIKVY